jgi:hypothetical protein
LFLCSEFKESDKLFHEARMPGAGHRFYFVGKVPFAFSVLFSLLFVKCVSHAVFGFCEETFFF